MKTVPCCANHVSVHPPLSQIRVGALLLTIRTGFCNSAIEVPEARSGVLTRVAYAIIRSEQVKSNSQLWKGFVTDTKAHCSVSIDALRLCLRAAALAPSALGDRITLLGGRGTRPRNNGTEPKATLDSTSAAFLSVARVRWQLLLQLDCKDAEERNWRTASSLFVHAQPSCGAPPEQVPKVSVALCICGSSRSSSTLKGGARSHSARRAATVPIAK